MSHVQSRYRVGVEEVEAISGGKLPFRNDSAVGKAGGRLGRVARSTVAVGRDGFGVSWEWTNDGVLADWTAVVDSWPACRALCISRYFNVIKYLPH